MTRFALAIALSLFSLSPAAAKTRCMGAASVLCSFAKAHRLKVISGYRKGARIAGTRRRSLHASGRAIDVYGCGSRCIRAARAKGFGLGFYRGAMHHVHISIGGPEAGRTFVKFVPRGNKRKHRYARR